MKSSSKRASKAQPPNRAAGPDPAVLDGARDGDVLEALLLDLHPREPAARARGALKSRILARATQPPAAPGIITIPASDEGWIEALPKIRIKRVYTDGTAESYLVRLEPGARAPAHDHPGDEECIVLEGSVRYAGGSTLKAGDYEAVQAGAHHSELISDTGALVFLRYAQPLAGYLKL
jgi:quercetin dioxygenase-like cupin family protein